MCVCPCALILCKKNHIWDKEFLAWIISTSKSPGITERELELKWSGRTLFFHITSSFSSLFHLLHVFPSIVTFFQELILSFLGVLLFSCLFFPLSWAHSTAWQTPSLQREGRLHPHGSDSQWNHRHTHIWPSAIFTALGYREIILQSNIDIM